MIALMGLSNTYMLKYTYIYTHKRAHTHFDFTKVLEPFQLMISNKEGKGKLRLCS